MDTLFNQLVFFAFFQSILLLCIYLFSAKNRKNINGYLAFLIFALLIGLSGRVLHISDIFGKNFRLIAFSEFATLLFGTTAYLFVRASLTGARFNKRDLLHYIPSVAYMAFIAVYFMIPTDTIIYERIESGELKRAIFACHAVGLLVNTIYWSLSLHEYVRFRESAKNEFSYSLKLQFLFNFIVAIGICLLVWIIVYLISISGFEMFERELRHFIWMSIALIVLFLAYYGMISPDVFRITPIETIQKYAQSRLSHTDLDRLKDTLETLMIDKKPYLNNKLLKAELAEMLGVSNPELARLLNENIGMNFFEFVNYYRIKEFISLAETEKAKTLTFFGLAQEAGFNSKTTFNKSFKRLMGASPTEYFNNHTS